MWRLEWWVFLWTNPQVEASVWATLHPSRSWLVQLCLRVRLTMTAYGWCIYERTLYASFSDSSDQCALCSEGGEVSLASWIACRLYWTRTQNWCFALLLVCAMWKRVFLSEYIYLYDRSGARLGVSTKPLLVHGSWFIRNIQGKWWILLRILSCNSDALRCIVSCSARDVRLVLLWEVLTCLLTGMHTFGGINLSPNWYASFYLRCRSLSKASVLVLCGLIFVVRVSFWLLDKVKVFRGL
jgi:hypothetical protein